MKVVELFKYYKPDGCLVISTTKPKTESFDRLYRLIADEGKRLTIDGEKLAVCVETDYENAMAWYEVDI